MSYKKLIQNIDELAARKGLSRTKALMECGAGKNFVNNIERKNGSKPGSDKLQQIAEYFGVSIDYLLGTENEIDNTPATERQLKFALFGTADIDDSILEDVKNIAKVLAKKKDDDNKEESDNDNTQ